MFGLFKNRSKLSKSTPANDNTYEFTWYDIGEDNPFNKRILDIRSLTQNTLSSTTDRAVAELFLTLRQSIGSEYIDVDFNGNKSVETKLVYPHNGAKIEGAAYKAKCMEDKWDIYGWNDIIYLTRSWTGELKYKAYISVSNTNFTIYRIEYSPDDYTDNDTALVINNVHFLINTLAFGKVYPHQIPQNIIIEKDIAVYSFSLFGHNCWYATYDNILDTVVGNN
jgi:hypothetical protein